MTIVVASPLTEVDYTTRQFFSSNDFVSANGLFTIPATILKRIKQVDFADASAATLSIIYKDKTP